MRSFFEYTGAPVVNWSEHAVPRPSTTACHTARGAGTSAAAAVNSATLMASLWSSERQHTKHKSIGPWVPFPGARPWTHWAHNATNILNKRLVVLASPGSGKTFLIKSLLISALKTHHPLIFNIAPAPTLGESQERFLPDTCYFSWEEFSSHDILEQLIYFQQQRVRHYKYLHQHVNELEHWKNIIMKIDKILDPALLERSREILVQTQRKLALAGANQNKCATIRKHYQITMRDLYTELIIQHRRDIMESGAFTALECGALSMVGIEPHVILVFDDLGESLKTWKPLINLWIKQRHIFITLVIIGHALRRQIPTTVRANTSIWLVHGAGIIKACIDEQLVPQGADKNLLMRHFTLIADAPHKFVVFGEAIEQNHILLTESEYTSNAPAYPFLTEHQEMNLEPLRNPAYNNGNYVWFFQRLWNLQFIYVNDVLREKKIT